MKDVFARLAGDFFSTIVFLALYLSTGNVVLATSVAIAGAVAQVIYARVKEKPPLPPRKRPSSQSANQENAPID